MSLIEEKIILRHLVKNEEYFVKVFPFLSKDHFEQRATQMVFQYIKEYNDSYKRIPDNTVMDLYLAKVTGVNDSDFRDLQEIIGYICEKNDDEVDFIWLCDRTLEFIQTREYFNALIVATEKYDKGEVDKELPDRLNAALGINFDVEIGMEFSDVDSRWDIYTQEEDKIPFLVDKFNEATNGGVLRKTLNCLMSNNTGGFKSGTMCSLTCDYLRQGLNVLYLTFEMAEDKIMERIDANLLDVEIDNLRNLGKEAFTSRVASIRQNTFGRLIVKQFPTSMCHVGHIEYLLRELRLKKRFVPDVVMFDYMGIMKSKRYGDNTAEHIWLKSVSEEVRGLCVEHDIIGWTGMQSNRGGASAGTALSITDISSSYGTTFGFDVVWGLITNEDFDRQCKIMFTQLKNRYVNQYAMPHFFVGVNKPKMKLFDMISSSERETIEFTQPERSQNEDDAERGAFTTRMNNGSKRRRNFTGFKFGSSS